MRIASKIAAAAFILFAALSAAHQDEMSRHFVAESLPVTDVVLASATTEGPYFEAESDYVTGADMVAAGRAGSAGVTADRASVVSGIPLSLTLNIYEVNAGATTAVEMANAAVFLWHCDAKGVYSAVPVSEQRTEGTVGQKWLRGVQTTPTNGSVTFNTILPGWYTGRTVHFHLRVRQSGSTNFIVTTQLFLSEAFVNAYKTVSPYTLDTQQLTTLSSDSIYTGVAAGVREKLVLAPSGTAAAGYTATFNLGVQVSSTSASSTSTAAAGVPVPPTTTTSSSSTASSTAAPLAAVNTPYPSSSGVAPLTMALALFPAAALLLLAC